jgi:large subunit ribosomal protein L17
MKHHQRNRKLGRKRDQRQALLRGLAENLVTKGKIRTTEARAKELRPLIEKLVTKARKADLASQREVKSKLGKGASKLIKEIAPRYKERKGGYTRITKLPARAGDASKMALIEFV